MEEQSEICTKGNGQEILQTQYTCTRKVKKIVRQIASIKGEWAWACHCAIDNRQTLRVTEWCLGEGKRFEMLAL